jgi:P-type Ca2+ transporter type 2C
MTACTQQMLLHAQVRRNEGVQRILASELLVGDIVLLQGGEPVPADCRLIECTNLRIQEAALTGESEPVDKSLSALDESRLPVCDQRNMAFMGTVVVAGHGLGVVTATGSHTEWSHIAALTQAVRRERRSRQHAEVHLIVTALLLVIIGMLLVFGILHGVLSMTMAAVEATGPTMLSQTWKTA